MLVTNQIRGFLGDLKAAIQGQPRDYTSGSLPRAVVLLAIPMMLEMVMQSVFGVVDVFFVGKLGLDAVSILGVTDALISLVFAMALGLSMGTTAMVARRIGERRPHEAARTAVQAIYLGSFIAIVMGVGGALMSGRLLAYMGMSEAAIEQGLPFTTIMLGFNITVVLLFLINAIFRGAGDAAIAMRSLWLANLINIVLDPILIFGWWVFPEMGLTGAAVATCVGRASGVAYQFARLVGPRGAIEVDRSCLKVGGALARRPGFFNINPGGRGPEAPPTLGIPDLKVGGALARRPDLRYPETRDRPGQAFFQADFGGPAQIPLRSFGVESNLEDFPLFGGAVVWVLRIAGQFLEFPE